MKIYELYLENRNMAVNLTEIVRKLQSYSDYIKA